jgi:hypothetical protein
VRPCGAGHPAVVDLQSRVRTVGERQHGRVAPSKENEQGRGAKREEAGAVAEAAQIRYEGVPEVLVAESLIELSLTCGKVIKWRTYKSLGLLFGTQNQTFVRMFNKERST